MSASFMAGFQHRFKLDAQAATVTHNHRTYPVLGAQAEVTSTGFGPFRRSYLTIAGPGYAWTARIDSMTMGRATRFAAAVNAAARAEAAA